MATLIAAQAQSGIMPRALHAGVNAVHAVYSLSATLSAGDIIQMCKLPDGARIVDVKFGSNVNLGANADVYSVGTRANPTALITSATCSAGLIFEPTLLQIGSVLDVSDDAAIQYSMIEVAVSTFAGTGTTSGAVSLNILYQLDQS